MFKSASILSALQAYLAAEIPSKAPHRTEANPNGWPHIVVELDECRSFGVTDFIPDPESPLDTYAYVIIYVVSDNPKGEEGEFDTTHERVLNVRFEIRALGFPVQNYIEPIANLICALVYKQAGDLSKGVSVFQSIIKDIGSPTIGYDAVSGDKEYSAGAIDIPFSYFSDNLVFPASYTA